MESKLKKAKLEQTKINKKITEQKQTKKIPQSKTKEKQKNF